MTEKQVPDCIREGCKSKAKWWRTQENFALCLDHIFGYLLQLPSKKVEQFAFDLAFEAWQKEQVLKCSFCGKSQHEVVKLVAKAPAYICNECIDLSKELIDEEMKEDESR